MRFISDEKVRAVLTVSDAMAAVEDALREYAAGQARNMPRLTIKTRHGTFRVMSASVPGKGVVGTKQGFWASEHQGKKESAMASELISLYDLESGEILALIQSHYLNQVRTGAAGAVAAKYLSRPDSRVVGLIGAGLHARTQLLGVCAVRKIEQVRVFSRSQTSREQFCREIAGEVDSDVKPVLSSGEAILGADVVILATSSSVPVLDGRKLNEGCHVTSIRGGSGEARELDDQTIGRATVFSVDSKEQIMIDRTGDVLQPLTKGLIEWEKVSELGDIILGKARGRQSAKDITVFKSVGMAIFDISVGKLVIDRLPDASE